MNVTHIDQFKISLNQRENKFYLLSWIPLVKYYRRFSLLGLVIYLKLFEY